MHNTCVLWLQVQEKSAGMPVSIYCRQVLLVKKSHVFFLESVFERYKKQALEKRRQSLSLTKGRKRSATPATYSHTARPSEAFAEMQQQVCKLGSALL